MGAVRWALLVGAGVLVIALGIAGYGDDAAEATPTPVATTTIARPPTVAPLAPSDLGHPGIDHASADHRATGRAGGDLPDHATPFDMHLPGIANLESRLLAAVQRAALDAREDGVPFFVTSGWRSRAHQQQLLDEAILNYASEEEARRFVATPDTSRHVTGEAVDIGPTDANSWLSQHGARYGLCQTYANEMWHFELATEPGGVCPTMLPDATSLR